MFECSLTNSYINNQNNAMIRYARDFWEFYWNLIFFDLQKIRSKTCQAGRKTRKLFVEHRFIYVSQIAGMDNLRYFFSSKALES